MAERWMEEKWAQAEDFWYSGKTTRRRFLGFGAAAAGALGATMAVPAWWRSAFGQAKPFKLGTSQPLSGTAAAGGKTALVGVQMALDHINRSGGIGGRPLDLLIADDESKPDTGRRKIEKMILEDKIDVHAGGYLSNICLACMPVFEEHRVLNMITVCLDTTITTTHCSRFTFRPFDFAPSQAIAIAPYLVNKMGKRWHLAFADYAWGQSTRDAYAESIKKNGGEVVGTTGVPLGTADMTAFLSKITPNFDGIFGIFFGPQGISFITQSFDLGISKKARIAGDGAVAVSSSMPAIGAKGNGFVGVDRYVPVLQGKLNTPYHKKFLDEAKVRLKAVDPSGPLPDRYVQSNYEGVNMLRIGMVNSKFQSRADIMKLVEALEGLEVKESDDFPQGDKTLRKEDHQAFVREFIFELQNMDYKIMDVVPKEKTLVPPACKFRA